MTEGMNAHFSSLALLSISLAVFGATLPAISLAWKNIKITTIERVQAGKAFKIGISSMKKAPTVVATILESNFDPINRNQRKKVSHAKILTPLLITHAKIKPIKGIKFIKSAPNWTVSKNNAAPIIQANVILLILLLSIFSLDSFLQPHLIGGQAAA